MKISVSGDCPSVRVLTGYLEYNSYLVTDFRPNLVVFLEEDSAAHIVVDAPDGDFSRHAVNCILELTKIRVLLERDGKIRNNEHIRVVFPPQNEVRDAVERGLLRAILIITRHNREMGDLQTIEKLSTADGQIEILKQNSIQLHHRNEILAASIEQLNKQAADAAAAVADLRAERARMTWQVTEALESNRKTIESVGAAETRAALTMKALSDKVKELNFDLDQRLKQVENRNPWKFWEDWRRQ